MKTHLKIGLLMGLVLSMVGCGLFTTQAPRIVLVPPIRYIKVDNKLIPTDLIKMGPDKIHVFVFLDGKWILSDNRVSVEGWLSAPPKSQTEKD